MGALGRKGNTEGKWVQAVRQTGMKELARLARMSRALPSQGSRQSFPLIVTEMSSCLVLFHYS